MKRVFVTVVLALGIVVVCGQVQADILVPTGATASSEYPGGGHVVGNLFDANFGTEYASYGDSGDTDPLVAMDFGSSFTFSDLMFAKRTFEVVDSIDLWFGSTPFTTVDPGYAAAESLDTSGAVNPSLTTYGFVGGHTGRYVLARLNSSYTTWTGNPGGSEMRLVGVVPEPSTLVLLTCGLLSLLAYAWRKRK